MINIIFFGAAYGIAQSQQNSGTGDSKLEKNYVDIPNVLINQARQLSFTGTKTGEGYFSADDSKMIFQSDRSEGNPFYQMYVMDIKSGRTDRLSPGNGKTTCGWIHPNLKKALWSSTHLDPAWDQKAKDEYENQKKPVKARYSWSFDENFDIFESDLKGKNLRRLTREIGYDAEASYSPDGKWIAFASNRSGYEEKLSAEDEKLFKLDPSYMMDIYIMKSDGTQVQRLTTEKGYDGGPFFSPDGKKIVWRHFATNGATAEIHTMNIDGSNQRAITNLKSMSWAPMYHPSGDYIVFASSVLGFSNFELFIVDSEGKQAPVRASFSEGFDGLASFNHTGDKITWTHRNEKGESQIYLADWEDDQARRLLNLPPNPLQNLSSPINEKDIKKIIYYLSSEKFAGRKTGGESEKIYTEQIANLLKSWGLKGGVNGSFFHDFEFTSGVQLGEKNELEIVGSFSQKLKVKEDFIPLSLSENGETQASPVVFAGYGLRVPASDKDAAYDSYANIDVKDKWVLIFTDIPWDISAEKKNRLQIYSRAHQKVSLAHNLGARGVLLMQGPRYSGPENLSKLKFEGSLARASIPVIRVSNRVGEILLNKTGQKILSLQEKLDKGEIIEPQLIPSVYLKSQIQLVFEKSVGRNVIAMLPVGAKKSVVLGAHGDHLGHGDAGNSLARSDEQGKAHYGADDNASGVAAVLELAHYFSKNKSNLKKNLYFAIWSGEEIGVLGSSRFLEKQDPKKYSAYINMDMIGRLGEKLFVQGVGSGNHWTQLSEEVGLKSIIPLSLQTDPYLPTDSVAFYMAGIPTLNFFTGAHAEYHTPRDVPELINFAGVNKITNVIGEYTKLLADSTVEMVTYQKVEGQNKQLEGRSFRIYLGTIPDYSQEGVKGVRISGVSKSSPAEQAGLLAKDIIVEFSGTKIENIYDYVYSLQATRPNIETLIKVNRNGSLVDLKITPKLKE